MSLKITILGCGHSAGTPAIGNHWGNCDPDEPKNRRTRASVLVQSSNANLLVDTGPDLRTQINRTDVQMIDAVIYTHAHSDHITGIDELRFYRMKYKRVTDIYATNDTMDELKRRFDYMFETRADGIYPQVINPHIIADDAIYKKMRIHDIEMTPYAQNHGTMTSLGYRFGDVAYSTDFVDLDDRAIETIKGVHTWIADGCGYKMNDNKVHASLKKLYAFNERIGAQRVIITHMPPGMDYQTVMNETPDGFEPAYDGMVIEA